MAKKPSKPKMGRPPLPAGKRRGASMGFRPTPEIREKLEEAASANGRSMSQEVEACLEQVFEGDEAFGGRHFRDLFRLFGNVAVLIERRAGKSCFEDWDTWTAVQAAWKRVSARHGPPPPEGWLKALLEATKSTTEPGSGPLFEDASLKALKALAAQGELHRYQEHDRLQEAVGEEIAAALLSDLSKKEG